MKKKSILLTLTGLLFSLCGYAQDESLKELIYKKQYLPVIERSKTFNRQDSTDFDTMYLVGQAYEGMLKYRNALQIYQYCYELDSLNTDLLTTMARTAMNLGQGGLAENCFKKILESDSTHFYANYQLGRLYYQLGEVEKAMDQFEFLLEMDEENGALFKSLGDCYIKLEEYFEGLLYYYHAYELNKENAGLASTVINLMLRLGDPFTEESLVVCDTALHYNPGNRVLQSNKAMALYVNKKYAEADTLYTFLLMQGDSTYNTLKYSGASRYYGGYPMRAIETLEPAYELDTTAVDVCLLLGSALGKTYDRKKAFALLETAEENMQPNPFYVKQLLGFRAETYEKDAKWDKATPLYYELWKLNPQRTDVLAKICYRSAMDHDKYPDEKSKQQGLFGLVLFCNEMLGNPENPYDLFYQRNRLMGFQEEMFFRNMDSYAMLAPDGKKSTISLEKLKELIEKLPTEKRKE